MKRTLGKAQLVFDKYAIDKKAEIVFNKNAKKGEYIKKSIKEDLSPEIMVVKRKNSK